MAAVYRKAVQTAIQQTALSHRRCRLSPKPAVYYTMPLNGAFVGRQRKLQTSRVPIVPYRSYQSPKILLSATTGTGKVFLVIFGKNEVPV